MPTSAPAPFTTSALRDVPFVPLEAFEGLYEVLFHVPEASGPGLTEVMMRVDYVSRAGNGNTIIRGSSGAQVSISPNGTSGFFKAPPGEACSDQACAIVDLMPDRVPDRNDPTGGQLTHGAGHRRGRKLWFSSLVSAVAIWTVVSSVISPPSPPPPFAFFRDSQDCLAATAAAEADPEYLALYQASGNYARAWAEARGYHYDGDPPSGSSLDAALNELASIYSDGASTACSQYSGVQADACALIGVWEMQLGTRDQVLEVLRARARDWTAQRLTDVREKDALWSWTYSRYFYRDWISWVLGRTGYANRLYLADNRETAMMELIVRSLQRDLADTSKLDQLYNAYRCANLEKYELMIIEPAGAAAAVAAIAFGGR